MSLNGTVVGLICLHQGHESNTYRRPPFERFRNKYSSFSKTEFSHITKTQGQHRMMLPLRFQINSKPYNILIQVVPGDDIDAVMSQSAGNDEHVVVESHHISWLNCGFVKFHKSGLDFSLLKPEIPKIKF